MSLDIKFPHLREMIIRVHHLQIGYDPEIGRCPLHCGQRGIVYGVSGFDAGIYCGLIVHVNFLDASLMSLSTCICFF